MAKRNWKPKDTETKNPRTPYTTLKGIKTSKTRENWVWPSLEQAAKSAKNGHFGPEIKVWKEWLLGAKLSTGYSGSPLPFTYHICNILQRLVLFTRQTLCKYSCRIRQHFNTKTRSLCRVLCALWYIFKNNLSCRYSKELHGYLPINFIFILFSPNACLWI